MHFAGNSKDHKIPSATGEDPTLHSRLGSNCPLLLNHSHCRDWNKYTKLFYIFVLSDLPEQTEEHANLSKALTHIRDAIAGVDVRVSEYERHQRLQEVWNRMENRSVAKLKSGNTFRKQDMMGQTLRHQGMLLWKTATSRLKGYNIWFPTDCYSTVNVIELLYWNWSCDITFCLCWLS